MDREWAGLDIESHVVTEDNQTPRLVCVSWYENEEIGGVAARSDMKRIIREYLESSKTLIGQNMPYDMACICAMYPDLIPLVWRKYDEGEIFDTFVADRLIDIALGVRNRPKGYFKLDSLASRYAPHIEIDKDSPWRTNYKALEHLPISKWPADALLYAYRDSEVLLPIKDVQIETAANHYLDDREVYIQEVLRQSLFAFPLHLMRCRGAITDVPRVEKLSEKVNAQIATYTAELQKVGLVKKDGVKNMALIRERIERLHRDPPKTKSGKETATSRDVIDECCDDLLTMVADREALCKVENTYLSKLRTGKVHAYFNVLGARTGRTSCSGPNLQNQPKKAGVRECFIPRPGHVFASCDFDTQEVRALAQVCMFMFGWSKLADRYKADPHFDPHTHYACTVRGIEYAEGLRLKAAGDPQMKKDRQSAKAVIFGVPGGLGIDSLVVYARNNYGVIWTRNEARKARERYFEVVPEAKDYFEHINALVSDGLATLHQIYSGRVRGRVGYTDGANSYFQGLASEASKTAVWLVGKACADPKSVLFGCHQLMLIHDEILLEVPEDGRDLHAVCMELKRLMIMAMEWWTPDVPAMASPALSRRWSKDVEPVFKNGVLIPWEDRDDGEKKDHKSGNRSRKKGGPGRIQRFQAGVGNAGAVGKTIAPASTTIH